MTSVPSPPPISIVIVSYNTRELLRRCLASLGVRSLGSGARGENLTPDPWPPVPVPLEVIVVDNASRDGSVEMVKQEFPRVGLVCATENLGFARATNLGLSRCGGDLLLLLNPDTEVIGDALARMAGFLLESPRVAAVGPALLFPDGRPQHAAFRFPNLWMSLFDFFPINRRIVDSRLNGRYRTAADGRPIPVDHPLGAAMMLRREALEDVGLLDESFFMYCEEVDWCIRARKRGWQIYHLPTAKIVHHVGQSSRQFKDEMLVELHRSRHRLFRKHYSARFVQAHRAITRLGLARGMAEAWWTGRRGQIDRAEMEKRMRAYRTIWGM